MLQQEQDRLTVDEQEALIEAQMSELNDTPEVKEQIAQVLRETYLKRFGSEPGPAREPDQYRLEQEEESDSSLDELEEKFGQDLAITPAVEAELKRDERERKDLERRKSGKSRVDQGQVPPRHNLQRYLTGSMLSQWSEEGKDDVSVSCLRCHNTHHRNRTLWAHVESKRCYPDTAIRGWREQAKEKEQKEKIEEAYQATVRVAIRKTPQRPERTEEAPPTLGPAPPPPMRDAQIVEARRPKAYKQSRVVQVKGDDRSRKGSSAPHLDDEAGVGGGPHQKVEAELVQLWLGDLEMQC